MISDCMLSRRVQLPLKKYVCLNKMETLVGPDLFRLAAEVLQFQGGETERQIAFSQFINNHLQLYNAICSGRFDLPHLAMMLLTEAEIASGLGSLAAKSMANSKIYRESLLLPKKQVLPHLYWINVESDSRRRIRMEQMLEHYHVCNSRVPAIEGMNDLHMTVFATGAPTDLRMEYSATASHLFAMKRFLDDRDNVDEYAWIAEDDLTFEYCLHWSRSFREYIDDMPKTWQVLQMSVFASRGVDGLSVARAVQRVDSGWFSAGAYLVKRTAAVSLLQEFMTITPSRQSRVVFPLPLTSSDPTSLLADYLIYRNKDTYTLPLFSYEGLDSTLHPVQLSEHQKYKILITEMWTRA